MNIEEKAKNWAEEEYAAKEKERLNRGKASKEYSNGYRAALTSLLEELPDTFDDYGMGKDAQAYRNDIKSLIQTN